MALSNLGVKNKVIEILKNEMHLLWERGVESAKDKCATDAICCGFAAGAISNVIDKIKKLEIEDVQQN